MLQVVGYRIQLDQRPAGQFHMVVAKNQILDGLQQGIRNTAIVNCADILNIYRPRKRAHDHFAGTLADYGWWGMAD
ncbi:MAG: hypothetical protein R3F55_04585 [Alphaproteobacteria bacterium]